MRTLIAVRYVMGTSVAKTWFTHGLRGALRSVCACFVMAQILGVLVVDTPL